MITLSNMKELILSKRMEAVASLVPEHLKTVADIGCDHAYVSIKLKQDEKADRIIAMDLRKGPLEIARQNVIKYEMSDHIELRLSDGMDKLSPKEADAIVIAGMGGLLMIDILIRGSNILQCDKPPALILQPQSDIREVRSFLYDNSYHITKEKMIYEDGKYYTAILATPGTDKPYDMEEDWIYGKYNIDTQDDILIKYLTKERSNLEEILNSLKGNASDKASKRSEEIELLLKNNKAAMERCRL